MKESLCRIVGDFSKTRLLVFGDFMLDEFVFGEISRVSREAPVLILKYREAISCPGGAANTVANAASLGAHVTAVGFLGDDPQADALLSLWPSEVNAENVFRAGEFKTTCKSRILAGSVHSFRQQVVRLDREHLLALEPEHESRLSDALQARIPGVTGIIISDYSLGNVTLKLRDLIIQLGKKYSIPVVVDSRDDPGGFPGATTVTPNITEVETVTGRRLDFDSHEIETVCSSARVKWDLEALLVTRGKHGISLFLKDRTVHIPAFGEEDVVDVTGAGDTVAAAYTSSLGAGASFEEAARVANYAGGLVVMKKGTATITPEELITAIRKGAES